MFELKISHPKKAGLAKCPAVLWAEIKSSQSLIHSNQLVLR